MLLRSGAPFALNEIIHTITRNNFTPFTEKIPNFSSKIFVSSHGFLKLNYNIVRYWHMRLVSFGALYKIFIFIAKYNADVLKSEGVK